MPSFCELACNMTTTSPATTAVTRKAATRKEGGGDAAQTVNLAMPWIRGLADLVTGLAELPPCLSYNLRPNPKPWAASGLRVEDIRLQGFYWAQGT